MSTSRVDAIARAVLYEGYALYPYRPSSVKNQRRFNFGLLAPQAVVEGMDQGYGWYTHTECLVIGDEPTVLSASARFLQLIDRAQGDDAEEPWLEAVERTVVTPAYKIAELAALGGVVRTSFQFDPVEGYLESSVQSLGRSGFRVRLRVANTTPHDEDLVPTHNDILPLSLVSTHSILSVMNGAFESLLDPAEEWRDAAAACINTGTYPVLAGEPGRRDVMLASPIILYDYPEVAADSPGDLFDGAEIDEILTLRILTLTDEEKDQMRRVDDRTRQLLERTEALTPDHMMKLHGVMRRQRAAASGG